MALKIRLARAGAKKRPYYRIVVAENTNPRDGRFVEKVGTYNPMLPQGHTDRIRLIEERIKHWMSVGAKPTDRVAKFLGQAQIIAMPGITASPKKSAPKAKAQERAREKAQKLEAVQSSVAVAPVEEAPVETPATEVSEPVEEVATEAPEAAEKVTESSEPAEAPESEAAEAEGAESAES